MLAIFDGYKAHIVSVLIILIGVSEGFLGLDIPGVEVTDPINYILTGLGLSSFRDAIRKLGM